MNKSTSGKGLESSLTVSPSGLLVPARQQPTLLLPPGVKRRENDPRLDGFLATLEVTRRTLLCPACGGRRTLTQYIDIFPVRRWTRLRCSVCRGKGAL